MDILALEALLNDFESRAALPMAWKGTREWFPSQGAGTLDDDGLKRAILRHGPFLADPDTWEIHNKSAFFARKEFTVLPSPYEVSERIFMPGDNLIPYLPYDCVPSDATFYHKGVKLKRRAAELPRDLLEKRFALFGKVEAALFISIDHAEAKQKKKPREYDLGPEDSQTRSFVFDAEALYAEPDFDPARGFSLVMRDHALFEIAPRPYSRDPGPEAREQEMEALSRGFALVFEKFPPDIGMDTQITHAYWLAFRRLPVQPYPALAEFMSSPNAPRLVELGMDTALAAQNADAARAFPESTQDYPFAHPCQAGHDLDRLLSGMGIPLRSSEIEAMMRSAPKSGIEDVEEALSEYFSGRKNAAEKTALRDGLTGLLAYVMENTDHFREGRISGLRSQALSQFLLFLSRSLRERDDGTFADRPKNDSVSIRQLLSELRSVIVFLNAPTPMDDAQLSALSTTITELCAALDILMSPQSPQTRKQTVSGPVKKSNADRTYVLSMSLAGMKPAITRRLAIPGDFSLADVSDCVLSAFGWSGSHLHCIRVNDSTYGKLDSASLPREKDEAETLLDDLPIIPESQFEYEYDFNSSWIVLIRVEEIVPAKERPGPRCLAGAGASPPEECGGPLKFMRALKGWKDKTSRDYALYGGFFGPGWDPDRFDLSGADGRIAAIARGKKGSAT